QLFIRGKESGRNDAIIRMALAVIVEMHDGNLLCEREQRTDVVAVIVRRPHVIDLLDAGSFQRIDDAAEVTVAGIAGVHEKRLTCRIHEERRLTTFCINVVDVQGAWSSLAQQTHDSGNQGQDCNHDDAHMRDSPCGGALYAFENGLRYAVDSANSATVSSRL